MLASAPASCRPARSLSDAELVCQARAGSRAAKTELYLRYRRMGRALACRRLRQSDAEDVLQEAFAEAFTHLERLERPQAFGCWFGSVVIRHANKHRRREAYWHSLRDLLAKEQHSEHHAKPDLGAELSRVFQRTRGRPLENQALLLQLAGWSLPEVALKLKTSLSTVKRRLVAARAHIAAYQSPAALAAYDQRNPRRYSSSMRFAHE